MTASEWRRIRQPKVAAMSSQLHPSWWWFWSILTTKYSQKHCKTKEYIYMIINVHSTYFSVYSPHPIMPVDVTNEGLGNGIPDLIRVVFLDEVLPPGGVPEAEMERSQAAMEDSDLSILQDCTCIPIYVYTCVCFLYIIIYLYTYTCRYACIYIHDI